MKFEILFGGIMGWVMCGAVGLQFCFISHSLGTVFLAVCGSKLLAWHSSLFGLTYSGVTRRRVLPLVSVTKIILVAEV
jgi:hypothetical protein